MPLESNVVCPQTTAEVFNVSGPFIQDLLIIRVGSVEAASSEGSGHYEGGGIAVRSCLQRSPMTLACKRIAPTIRPCHRCYPVCSAQDGPDRSVDEDRCDARRRRRQGSGPRGAESP